MTNKININQNQLYSASGALDPRFIVDSVDKIENISNAYVGLEVSVINSEENTLEKYRIKKINNLTNKPLPANEGGYELIQEPKDLKYPDDTSFLNSNKEIDIDTLKLKNIPELQPVPMLDGFYYTISNNTPWEGQILTNPVVYHIVEIYVDPSTRYGNLEIIMPLQLSQQVVNFGTFSQSLINNYPDILSEDKQFEISIFNINKCSNGYLSSNSSYKFKIPLNVTSNKTSIKTEDGINLECGIGSFETNYKLIITLPENEPNISDYRVVLSFSNIQDVSEKMDKILNPTSGNLPELDSNGNLVDSGTSLSDLRTEVNNEYIPKPSIDPTDGQILSYDETDGTKWVDNTTVHIKYAATDTPNVNDMHDSIQSGDLYIGIYSDNNSSDSVNYNDYKWSKIVGIDGTNGLSAYQQWREAGYTGDETDFLNSLKAHIAGFKSVSYDANAPITIGSTVSAIDGFSASVDTMDKIVLMPNSDNTATIMYITTATQSGGTTTYAFSCIGELNIDTSDFLDSSNVDETGLANPTISQVAKAIDVMSLQSKLGEVTAKEDKVSLSSEQDKAINGNNGELCTDTYGKHFVVNLASGVKRIRFLAAEVSNLSSFPYGYCFYSDNEGTVVIKSGLYKLRAGSSSQPYELVIDVPDDAVVFKFSVASANRDSVYCYLQSGESVVEMIPEVVDNLEEGGINAALSAEQGKEIGKILMGEGEYVQQSINLPSGNAFIYYDSSTNKVSTGSSNTAKTTGLIEAVKGDKFFIKGRGGDDSDTLRNYGVVASDGETVLFIAPKTSGTTHTPKEFTITQDGAAYFFCNFGGYVSTDYCKKQVFVRDNDGLVQKVAELNQNVLDINSMLYEVVDLDVRNTTRYPYIGGAIDNSTKKWRASNYKFILVEVLPNVPIKITSDNSNNTRYIFFKQFSSSTDVVEGQSAVGDFCANYANVSELPTLTAGTSIELTTPSDAKYLYCFAGNSSVTSTYPYRPSKVEVTLPKEFGSSNNTDSIVDVQIDNIREENVNIPMSIGAIKYNLDSSGNEIVDDLQRINMLKKITQMINLKWKPKLTIVGRLVDSNTYTANTQVSSPPYGNNDGHWKRIGVEVTLHTFMTSVNNKYSLLYTERTLNGSSRSAWGYTWTCENGGLYYGTMCCGFHAYVTGRKYYLNNPYHDEYSALYGELYPIGNLGEVVPELLKIGDVADNQLHSFVITNIKRDSGNNITQVVYAECNAQSNACHFSGQKTLTQFKNIIANTGNEHGGTKFTLYRDTQLNNNFKYEVSPFVKGDSSEPEPNFTYNNEICTLAGDKACFNTESLIVLNYNLDGESLGDYDRSKVYKDNVLLYTYTIGDPNYSYSKFKTDNNLNPNPQNTIEDMNDHVLVLGKVHQAGKYKACLSDGINDSNNFTYWEVVETPTVTRLGEDEYEVSLTGLSNRMIKIVCGSYTATRKGRAAAFMKVVGWDYYNNSIKLYPKRLIEKVGIEPVPSKIYIRVAVEGDYGISASPMINITDIEYNNENT